MSEDTYIGEGKDFGSIVLDFSSQAYARIQQIRGETEVRTSGDVIRNAIRFNKWYMKRCQLGDEVQFRFEDSGVFLEEMKEGDRKYRIPLYFFNRTWPQLQEILKISEDTSAEAFLRISLHRYDQYLVQAGPDTRVRVRTKQRETFDWTLSFI